MASRTTTYTPPRTNMLHDSRYTERTAKLKSMTAEDEPRRALPDGVLGDAARIEGGRCEIAEHDRGGAPERDERERYGCGDHHLRSGVWPGFGGHEFPDTIR